MKLPAAILQVILVAFLVGGAATLYFLYPAYSVKFYPKCIFHNLTGLYCPGCGSQRAASALLHGNLRQALNFNVFFVLCIPLVAYSGFVATWNAFSEKKIQQRIFYSPGFVKVFLVLVLVFFVLRNLETFKILAPH